MMRWLGVTLLLVAGLVGCATTGSSWSPEVSRAHMETLEGLSPEALEREADAVISGEGSSYAPDAYVLYAFALAALESNDPEQRRRGMTALTLAALRGEPGSSYALRPRAGQAPAVQSAATRRGGLPEAQYRLYQEWIDDPERETEALYVLMRAALTDYPPAVEAWEREEEAGRFDGGER